MSHTKRFEKNLVRQLVGRIKKKTPESVGEIPLQREVKAIYKKISNGKAKNCGVCSNRKVKRI